MAISTLPFPHLYLSPPPQHIPLLTSGIYFSVTAESSQCSPYCTGVWAHGKLSRGHSLKERCFAFPGNYQLSVAPRERVGSRLVLPCARDHRCYSFLTLMPTLCPEDGISQPSSPSFGFYILFLSPLPWCSLILGTGRIDIDDLVRAEHRNSGFLRELVLKKR